MNLRSKYHEFSLPNGLKISLFEIPSVMSVYANLDVGVGASFEKNSERGISHFLEHSAFLGTNKYPAESDMTEVSENHGISYNAATGGNYTNYWVRFPNSEIDLGFKFLSELVFNPIYDRSSIQKERSVIFAEHEDFWHNPEHKFNQKVVENRFRGNPHPYSYRPLGIPELFMKVEKKDILRWRDKHYGTKNMFLCIAGGIKFKEVEKTLLKYFGSQKAGKASKSPEFSEKDYSGYNLYFQREDRPQISFNFNFPSHGWRKKDRVSRIAEYLALRILGGSRSSRLYTRIRSREHLVYGISSFRVFFEHLGYMGIAGSCTTENLPRVARAIKEEVDSLLKNGISDSELNTAKNSQTASNRMKYDNPGSIVEDIVGQVNSVKEKYWFPEDYEKATSKITVQDVNNALKEIVNYKRININLMGDLKEKQIKDVEEIFRG